MGQQRTFRDTRVTPQRNLHNNSGSFIGIRELDGSALVLHGRRRRPSLSGAGSPLQEPVEAGVVVGWLRRNSFASLEARLKADSVTPACQHDVGRVVRLCLQCPSSQWSGRD